MSGKLMGSMYALKLTKAQRAVALALADHGNDDGSSIFPSVGRVAWKVELSERSVQRVMRELEQIGLLVRVADERQHRAVEYRMDVSAAPTRPDYDPNLRKRRVRQVRHPDVAPEENGRCDISEFRCDISALRCDTQMSPEPSIEPSVEPTTTTTQAKQQARTSSVPVAVALQARAKLAPAAVVDEVVVDEDIAELFEEWRHKLRDGSPQVRLTKPRFEVMRWRLVNFSIDELKTAIEGAAQALAADVLDYGHKDTELYRIVMDDEHARGWIAYAHDGDDVALTEMLASEMPKEATA
jgi:hypothetical protein